MGYEIMQTLHEQTKRRAFDAGKRDAKKGRELNSKSRPGSMWDMQYRLGYINGVNTRGAKS